MSAPDPLVAAFRAGFVRAWVRAEIGRECRRIRAHSAVLAAHRAIISRWCRQRREVEIIELERARRADRPEVRT
jgi:hypothetical protein